MYSSVRFATALKTALVTALLLAGAAAIADPPDHAKAHGWRKKNDPRYVGYTGREWERDYGVLEGTCNRKEIGTVLGAVVGGAIGSQVGDGSGRTVAIIVGSRSDASSAAISTKAIADAWVTRWNWEKKVSAFGG